MAQNNQRQSNQSLASLSGHRDKTVEKKLKFRVFFVVMVLGLNILNCLVYNTGWAQFQKDDFDIIWSTAIVCLNISGILFAMFLGDEKLD